MATRRTPWQNRQTGKRQRTAAADAQTRRKVTPLSETPPPTHTVVVSSPIGLESLDSAGTAPTSAGTTESPKTVALSGRVTIGSRAGASMAVSRAPGEIRGEAAKAIGDFSSMAEGYVVPAAAQSMLADIRANVLPRLVEIETALNRLAPVLEQLEKSEASRHGIGGNKPPLETIEAAPLTLADLRITLIADRAMRVQLSPDRPTIDREGLALAWQVFKNASKGCAALARYMTSRGDKFLTAAIVTAGAGVGTALLIDPTQFHQDLLNLQTNLESVVSGLEHFLRAVGVI